MTARERFAEAKARLDALDDAVGKGIAAMEAELRDAGVAVTFLAYKDTESDGPGVWWGKHGGEWAFHQRSPNMIAHINGAPRHVRRAFFRAVTVEGLFDAATAAYRAELGEESP